MPYQEDGNITGERVVSTPNEQSKTNENPKFVDRFDEFVLGLFAFAERGLLLLIGGLAIVAVGFELKDFIDDRRYQSR